MSHEPTDMELIDAINQGDSQAFEQLYYRHRDWVFNLAYRFTHNHTDALDVLQEVFTYLLRKFPGFKLTAAMTTFLYPVVKHLSFALYRKGSRYIGITDEHLTDLHAVPSMASADDSRAELAVVIGRLPAEQQEIILMRFVDDMSLEEIAQALELPSGTVKSRLYRALQALREDERTLKYFME